MGHPQAWGNRHVGPKFFDVPDRKQRVASAQMCTDFPIHSLNLMKLRINLQQRKLRS